MQITTQTAIAELINSIDQSVVLENIILRIKER